MKVEIKGIVHHVGQVQVFEKFKMQEIIIRKPAYVDEFGDKKGDDQFFPVTLFNTDIEKYDAFNKLAGKKVTAVCYLNGRSKIDMGATKYFLQLKPQSISTMSETKE